MITQLFYSDVYRAAKLESKILEIEERDSSKVTLGDIPEIAEPHPNLSSSDSDAGRLAEIGEKLSQGKYEEARENIFRDMKNLRELTRERVNNIESLYNESTADDYINTLAGEIA